MSTRRSPAIGGSDRRSGSPRGLLAPLVVLSALSTAADCSLFDDTPTPSPVVTPPPTPTPPGGHPDDDLSPAPDPHCVLDPDASETQELLSSIGLDPETCGGGEPRSVVALCGDTNNPCQVEEATGIGGYDSSQYSLDLTVSPEGRPSLLTMGTSSATYAEWDERGRWQVSAGAEEVQNGALAPAPNGGVLLLSTYPYASLWYRGSEGGWVCVEDAPVYSRQQSDGMLADGQGCLVSLALQGDPSSRLLAKRARSWAFEDLGTRAGILDGAIGLSPAGKTHFMGRVNNPQTQFVWRGPDGALEQLGDTGPMATSGLHVVVIERDGVEVPHAMYMLPQQVAQEGNEVLWSERVGDQQWVHHIVAQEHQISEELCDWEPAMGDTCVADYTTYRPVGGGASQDGTVRFVYLALRNQGEYVAKCPSQKVNPGGTATPVDTSCYWEGESTQEGGLVVASLGPSGVTTQRVEGATVPGYVHDGEAVVDATGAFHVATVAWQDGGQAAYYVRLR